MGGGGEKIIMGGQMPPPPGAATGCIKRKLKLQLSRTFFM